MKRKSFCILAMMVVVFASCKKEADNTVLDSNSNTNQVEAAADAKAVDPNAKYATMDFDKTVHDFGTIKEGENVTTEFVFTNNGDTDLLITRAHGSCGCTVPDYPKTPIKPGEKGNLTVSFNSAGKKGMQNKDVKITVNTQAGIETVNIKANVTPDPNKPASN